MSDIFYTYFLSAYIFLYYIKTCIYCINVKYNSKTQIRFIIAFKKTFRNKWFVVFGPYLGCRYET